MKCCRLIFVFLFYMANLLVAGAIEYRGYVEPIQEKIKTYQPGDIFEGRLVLYPFNNLISEIQIEEKVFLNHFYILKMLEIGFSENNHEALEISFRAIVREVFDTSKSINLPLKNNYQVEFRNFKVEGDVKPAQDFHVLEHKFSVFSFQWIIVAFSLLLILLLFVGIRYFPSFQAKRLRQRQLNKFVEKIKEFKNREEFEKIYWDKYLWKEIVDLDMASWKKLSKELNSIQYQRTWNSEQLELMRRLFSEFIREVKNGI